MELIIDRFEDDIIVCEDENRNIINLKKKDIPKNAKEGDILNLVDNKYILNKSKTKKRKEYIEDLTKDLWE